MVDEIYARVERDELEVIDHHTHGNTYDQPDPRTHDSDHETLHQKNSEHCRGPETHCLEDPYLSRLVRHNHCERAHNVERCDNHDEQQDHTHRELLELERVKER